MTLKLDFCSENTSERTRYLQSSSTEWIRSAQCILVRIFLSYLKVQWPFLTYIYIIFILQRNWKINHFFMPQLCKKNDKTSGLMFHDFNPLEPEMWLDKRGLINNKVKIQNFVHWIFHKLKHTLEQHWSIHWNSCWKIKVIAEKWLSVSDRL